MLRYLFMIWTALCFSTAVAQDHTQIVGISLGLSPQEVIQELCNKGLQQEDTFELSGRVAGLRVWVYVSCNKDSSRVNHILLTTQEEQNSSYREDYGLLMRWMQRNYGAPSWHSTVRSHPFARWFVDFDHDIVMIATASAGVEIWFYENHQRRNIDYYAILKYCERNPASGLPVMFARDNVTWKSTGDTSVVKKKKVAKRKVRKATKKKAKPTKKRRSKTVKSKKQRRKR